jgi:cytochrome c oxidase cbb3-type subunit 1
VIGFAERITYRHGSVTERAETNSGADDRAFLAISFLVSLAGLAALIWAVSTDQFCSDRSRRASSFMRARKAALTIRPPGAPHRYRACRDRCIDRLARQPVSGRCGTVARSGLALRPCRLAETTPAGLARWKRRAHVWPDSDVASHARHLWLAVARRIGTATWIVPRIFHTPLRSPRFATWGAIIWNAGLTAGCIAIASGWTDGEEWLEIPWQIDTLLAIGGGLAVVPLLRTAFARSVEHIYVSGWYFLAALCWFPALFIVANIPGIFVGAEQATVNWWFAHNVLGCG